MYCTICGQQHDTAACPPPLTPVMEQQNASFEMTINGMTPFEHALIERFDKLIALVQDRHDHD